MPPLAPTEGAKLKWLKEEPETKMAEGGTQSRDQDLFGYDFHLSLLDTHDIGLSGLHERPQ